MKLELGLYWARVSKNDPWELVEVRPKRYRKPGKYVPGVDEATIFVMGWDIDEPPSNFVEFIKANLVTPDGENAEKNS